MGEATFLPGLFTVLATIEVILGIFILLANPRSNKNRATSGLMFLLSINNISVIGMLSGIAPRDALIYHWMLIATTYAIGPALFLASLLLLKENLGRLRIATLIAAVLIAVAPIITTLDALGVTEFIIGETLLYTPLNPGEFLRGYVESGDLTTGMLRPFFLVMLIGMPLLTLIYPTLLTGIRDRKTNPENSNFAFMLFGATLLSTLIAGFRGILNPAVVVLGQNLIFTIGFTFVGFLRGRDQLEVQQLQQAVADWSMLNKLRLAVGTIALPAIVISGVVAINFFQTLMVDSTGENLVLLADAELRNVTDEVNRQVDNLLVLAEDPLVISSVTFRESTYFGLDEEAIRERIAQNEATWVSSEDDSSFVAAQLSAARSSSLLRFREISPSHVELVLSDHHGALYTATGRTENYDQSGYEWWQAAYNNGDGAVYISNPEFDAEIGQYVIEMAVPVFSQTRVSELFGVLLSRYSLEGINQELGSVTLGETGGVALFSATGEWLPTDPTMMQQDPNLNWGLLNTREENWAVTLFSEVDSIISWASSAESQSDSHIDLQVVTQMPTDEALAGIVLVRNIGYLVFIVIAVGALTVTFILANLISQPLERLTDAAHLILEGETNVQAEVMGKDEIGILASTFNSMTSQLSQLVLGLEETVEERTLDLARRALQLETAAEVARESAAIRDVNELLVRTTHLISERFGYYHTGIFLLDDSKEFAVLQAANSPGGERMLARGHKLEVGKVGVVGYAAGQAEPRIAQDVGADVIYYDNPDMPETQSEMALPLMIRNEVIGVLDVQSEQSNAFGQEDVQVLQTLADQIALAIENARLLESSQSALNELEYLYGREIGQAWEKQFGKTPIAFTYTPSGTKRGGDDTTSEDENYEKISREISYRGHALGSIDLLREKGQKGFSEEELAMIDEVIEQTALALENARLTEQIRLRSDQIQLLQEVTALAASTLDENILLEKSAERIRAGLNLNQCAIALFLPGSESAEWKAVAVQSGAGISPAYEKRFGLDNEVALEAIRNKKAMVFYDVQNSGHRDQVSAIAGWDNVETAAFVPMVVRDQIIGLICLTDSNAQRKFDEEEINLLNQISSQVSGAIDVVQLFEAEQKAREAAAQRAEREHLVASITTKVRASTNPQTIIKTAIDELRQALGPEKRQKRSPRIEDSQETNGQGAEGKAKIAKDENNER